MKIRYGKDGVSVYRTDGVRTLFGSVVRIDVFGDSFEAAYTEGDNSAVVATGTMKNLIHTTALEQESDSLEELAVLLGNTFLGRYESMDHLRLAVREVPLLRQSDVLFQRVERDYGVAEITIGRDGVTEHSSGREGLHLVKITGSAFASLARDEHTTLPEVHDRPLFVYLDVSWTYGDCERRVSSEGVRDLLLDAFDDFVSLSSSIWCTRWAGERSSSSRNSRRSPSRRRTASGTRRGSRSRTRRFACSPIRGHRSVGSG